MRRPAVATNPYQHYDPVFDYWKKFDALRVWEIAALMRGIDPRAMSDVTNPNGDALDLSHEEYLLTLAIRQGTLTALPPVPPVPDSRTEIDVRSLVPWLHTKGYGDLAAGLTPPPIDAGNKHTKTGKPDRFANGEEGESGDSNATRQPEFHMKKSAMIARHKSKWPTIEADMKAASENGLSAAKAKTRDWIEAKAIAWARSKGKWTELDSPSATLTNAMNSLPSTKHSRGD